MSQSTKPPIINCHSHIFTGDHVPPYLAKSVVPGPFYKLLNFQKIFARFRNYYERGDGKKRNTGTANDKRTAKYKRRMRIERNPVKKWVLFAVGVYLTVQATDILLHWAIGGPQSEKAAKKLPYVFHRWLEDNSILLDLRGWWWQVLWVLVVLLFFKSGRNFLILIAKNLFSFLKKIPGKEAKQLFERYLTIGRYAFHREQETSLRQLENQYPIGSGFVILPMDMEYMEAGAPSESYKDQMAKLALLKENQKNHIYPFVFADPRRIAEDPDYFQYYVEDGEVKLRDCYIKTYIEDKKFSGFKIYPALGYYPFDPLLLPLWKYAAQKQLPIMTHCVRGPMYYRGSKKPEWDTHPVFGQSKKGGKGMNPLLLPEIKNVHFSANFTHPLNYAILFKEEMLAQFLQTLDPGKHKDVMDLFGLEINNNPEIPPTVKNNLSDLKLCFGHYGGNDEWNRYFETDRYGFSNELATDPYFGIDFLYRKSDGERSYGKPEQLWKHTDWYSIISSLMLQHKNVYADISYILHSDLQILPLLKQTLDNRGLRSKVLYGTDFFVVRNHKSDKNMLADMMGGLDEEDFDQIARFNPQKFLANMVDAK